MLSVDIALKNILDQAQSITETEMVPIHACLGRTLAVDQQSSINVPPADNSAMDGYAINTNDLNDSQSLSVSQIITAGKAPSPLASNTAARIFTGAEIPPGANAVVMQEQCEEHNGRIVFPENIPESNNIRCMGQDITINDTILKQGRLLQAPDIGLLASIGIDKVPVFRRLTIAILSTGNELVDPGQPLKSGQIYNSNRYLLNAFLQKLGVNVLDLGVIKDSLVDTKEALTKASQADCIISTGGVSVGDEDHVKPAVTELGRLDLWRIALKPGKPLAFGHVNNTPFFGLPGNPVSTFLTFLLFVRPYLLIRQGQYYREPEMQKVIANFNSKPNPKRQEYLRVMINGNHADAFANQSSGVLSSVVQSNGLAVIPIGTEVKTGDSIHVIPFSQLF